MTASYRFENSRKEPLDVYVEPWPERFRLKPGEVLEIHVGGSTGGEDVRVEAHAEGVTLWADVGEAPDYLIDGAPAKGRSWAD